MTFIHGYLLGGLLLAGVPVLLHLILRQKPKRLPFPAFRFLKARQRINTRKMQLQHLLLLLLRILVLAALCLALARPRIFSGRLGLGGDRPVVAVLLFDTSPSMEYAVGGVIRLEEARKRARELLDEMKPDSRIALLDVADDAQDVLLPPGEARARLEGLRLRPGAGSLNPAVDRALRLLDRQEGGEDGPPRLLYVFSDRTRGSWDASGVQPRVPEGVNVLFVDVGVETPRDLGIEKIEIVPPVVAPGGRYEVRVSVRGTPGGHENELSCSLDDDPDRERLPDRKPIQLDRGLTGDTLVFERRAPTPAAGSVGDVPYQITARLGTRDAMPFNNARHATFIVRVGRKLLTLVNQRDPRRTRVWESAHEALRSFTCDVRTFDEADKLSPAELSRYSVIALFENTSVPAAWWKRLAAHVRAGGGLAIVPGGEEILPGLKEFNEQGLAADLLPAPLVKLARAAKDTPVPWAPFSGAHPLMAPFVAWARDADADFARDDLTPQIRGEGRYWQLGRLARGALSISSYADPDRSPALAERSLGKGRVVLFTTPLDIRYVDDRLGIQWNTLWDSSSFGLVLIDRTCRYLAGEIGVPLLNFPCGQAPHLTLLAPPEPPLSVNGPALAGAERNLKLPGEDGTLVVAQAQAPGNYQVLDGKGRPLTGFSLDVPARESDLDRVPTEELEQVLGTGSVIQVGRTLGLREALARSRPAPIELLPYLMMLLLVVLTLDSLLANRFYRRPLGSESPPAPLGGTP